MNVRYKDWVEEYVLEHNVIGKCAEMTLEMVKAFPDLERVRGHYHCPIWGEREHWWCVDWYGNVVDPTASQFPSKGIGLYVAWEEGKKEPTGTCMNCGAYCYDHDYLCSDRCRNIIEADIANGTF